VIKALFTSASLFLSTWRVYFIVGAVIVLTASSFYAGWKLNGWRLGVKVVELEKELETTRADANQLAFDDLYKATTDMKNAALEYTQSSNNLTTQINVIRKDIKAYAKTNPLPADCKPDARRVQSLTDAISKANASAN